MKKYKALVSGLRRTETICSPQSTEQVREEYKSGSLFKVGDLVETKDGVTAEVVHLGTNYLTLAADGKSFKKWLHEVTATTDCTLHASDEICGYKPRSPMGEAVLEMLRDNKDQYAVLNTVQCIDRLSTLSEITDFNRTHQDFERCTRYFTKFNIDHAPLSKTRDMLFEYAIINDCSMKCEGAIEYSTKLLKTIFSLNTDEPMLTLNESIDITRKNQGLSPSQGWQILGTFARMMKNNGLNLESVHPKIKTLMGV